MMLSASSSTTSHAIVRGVVTRIISSRCVAIRCFSTTNNKDEFIPRRRSNPQYRPLAKPPAVQKDVFELQDRDNDLLTFGSDAADALRHSRALRKKEGVESHFLRMADYMTARPGTTEHYVSERRALAMDLWDHEDRSEVLRKMDELVETERIKQMELGDDDMEPINKRDLSEESEEEPNQLVHGDWAESIIQVDRVQKVQRGGTMVRYRALLLGGNGQGVAGFGIAKANSPAEATTAASRICKRNIYFCDRVLNKGLTRDLVGKHNSCKVFLRATSPNYGLKGHDLVKEILILMGITDCSCKTHGNRNPYNVVRATFKAIATHESMEEIALKRGKRLLSLERVKRLQI